MVDELILFYSYLYYLFGRLWFL